MEILNQPYGRNLGDVLIELLHDNYNRFFVVVAYAKESGVRRLSESILQFRQNGGTVSVVVGIDQTNTSVEALRLLLEICDNVFVYHNENFNQTFHPKVYTFNNDDNAKVIVGSSNLTTGGLYINNETNVVLTLDLHNSSEEEVYNHSIEIFNSYSSPDNDFSRQLTPELLNELISRNYILSELDTRRGIPRTGTGEATEHTPIFGRRNVIAPRIGYDNHGNNESVDNHSEPQEPLYINEHVPDIELQEQNDIPNVVAEPQNAENILALEIGFWKRLSNNDISPTSSPGQIIIPIRFLDYFPEFSHLQITNAEAGQSEVYFNVIFINSNLDELRVNDVRAIHYFPALDHPRKNSEIRFTFHNQQVFNQLRSGDILEFRRTNSDEYWFIIRQLSRDTDENQILLDENPRGFNVINED